MREYEFNQNLYHDKKTTTQTYLLILAEPLLLVLLHGIRNRSQTHHWRLKDGTSSKIQTKPESLLPYLLWVPGVHEYLRNHSLVRLVAQRSFTGVGAAEVQELIRSVHPVVVQLKWLLLLLLLYQVGTVEHIKVVEALLVVFIVGVIALVWLITKII